MEDLLPYILSAFGLLVLGAGGASFWWNSKTKKLKKQLEGTDNKKPIVPQTVVVLPDGPTREEVKGLDSKIADTKKAIEAIESTPSKKPSTTTPDPENVEWLKKKKKAKEGSSPTP